MSQAANIISTATQVPDIVRGVAGAKDLQLADSYQFSSILRHLVDRPEKTMEAARGPEKDNEPLLRPKTVEDTRNADGDRGPDLGDQRSASKNFTEQAVPVPENHASQDDQTSQNNHSPDEPASAQAPERAEYAPQEDAIDDFVAALA